MGWDQVRGTNKIWGRERREGESGGTARGIGRVRNRVRIQVRVRERGKVR